MIVIANAVLQASALSEDWLVCMGDEQVAAQIETQAFSATTGWHALRNVVLGDQPLNEYLSLSDLAAIRATSRADVQQWHAETVVSDGALIAVAGPLTEVPAGTAVDALFAGLPTNPAAQAVTKPLSFAPRSIILHLPAAEKTTLGIIAQAPTTGDDGEVNDLMGSLVLGGDAQSLLFDAIRTKLRASYDFSAALDAHTRQDRILVMSGEVEAAQTAAVRDVVIETHASLLTTPVPAQNMDFWKAGIAEQLTRAASDTVSRSNAMIEAMLDRVVPLRVLQLPVMLAKTTPESVQARMKARYSPADALLIIAVSSDAKALPGDCVITHPDQAVNCP